MIIDIGGGNRYEASGLESENRGASLYGANDQRDPNMFNRGNGQFPPSQYTTISTTNNEKKPVLPTTNPT